MDDLEFRRTIYADPNCDDIRVKEAAAQDPAKQEFWSEQKKIDASLQAAMKVDVPDDLAHKLILRQTMQTHQHNKKRARVHLALAASLAFVVGVSFTLWQQQNYIDLSAQSLAHVYHEGPHALDANEDFTMQQVNAKLAQYGGHLNEDMGQIFYANHCVHKGVKSLHLVMQGENGKVTVFVVPHKEGYKAKDRVSDGYLTAEAVEMNNTSLVIVSENVHDVEQTKNKLTKGMTFSA
ncbi:DUF3379 domain-containing protein [Paraglaciecola mesophila]|uniref:DUF3379 domain-containing protein n=1 Tax=Paraglaciecola mesophila TaxID=197222 RepID=A0ABU9SQ83_9ALTE